MQIVTKIIQAIYIIEKKSTINPQFVNSSSYLTKYIEEFNAL